ncbi:hypothetical protein Ddc_03791 [Ditylenchus destructor]|nr:hypothetical protein Ddc_03791 [Ditylenchus destructor]
MKRTTETDPSKPTSKSNRLFEYTSTQIHYWKNASLNNLPNIFRHSSKTSHDTDQPSTSPPQEVRSKTLERPKIKANGNAFPATTFGIDQRKEILHYDQSNSGRPSTRDYEHDLVQPSTSHYSTFPVHRNVPIIIQQETQNRSRQYSSRSNPSISNYCTLPRRQLHPTASQPYIFDSYYDHTLLSESIDDVEMWMKEQPIGLRKLERHDRIRLKIAG